SILIVVVALLGSAACGAGLAWLLARSYFGAKVREAQGRTAHVQKARAQTNELLAQARRQMNLLRQELEIARRLRAMPRPAQPRVEETRDEAPPIVLGRQAAVFADTLPFAA